MRAADLFVRCLENEGVEVVFGVPGEENLDLLDALAQSSIRFVPTRHEQGAAFMADVYGRLTGRAGVCLSTLGPGSTNLVTGVADANMDGAPLVAISGQASTARVHKQSHQVIDLVRMFEPITKYCARVRAPKTIPEIVRKAFKVAQAETPGACFLELPEDVAVVDVQGPAPLRRQSPPTPIAAPQKIAQAAQVISEASWPLILAGHGVIRAGASADLVRFAETLHIPVATTFMAKGVIPFSHPLSVGAVGLKTRDYASAAFEAADLIICVGFDMVEYRPYLWHKDVNGRIIHIHAVPAEVDEDYIMEVGVLGQIGVSLEAIAEQARPHQHTHGLELHAALLSEMSRFASDDAFPLRPQRILSDLRRALDPDDLIISDVGAHKIWVARMYSAERPNTCLMSNGFASMGISVPGALAAKMLLPEHKVVAVTGDGGFLLNSQELETAAREGVPFVVLIWNDHGYGLIRWKQEAQLGRTFGVDFGNPDFVKYAESYGARGYRVNAAAELLPILRRALEDPVVSVIDCPVDYSENLALVEHLGVDAYLLSTYLD
jgi:acetolactate synthase-1/2/3 large subunit